MFNPLVRLAPKERWHFQRFDRTFKKAKRTCDKEISEFFQTIIEKNDKVVENESNTNSFILVKSEQELGRSLPQSLLNIIIFNAFHNPNMNPYIDILSNNIKYKGWYMHALMEYMKLEIGDFMKSIQEDRVIWNLILYWIEVDHDSKKELLSLTSYKDLKISFAVEFFLFFWPINNVHEENLSVANLASYVINDLIELGSNTAFRIVNMIFSLFPNEVFHIISNSKQYSRINGDNLANLSKFIDFSQILGEKEHKELVLLLYPYIYHQCDIFKPIDDIISNSINQHFDISTGLFKNPLLES